MICIYILDALTIFSPKEAVAKAELLILMKKISNNESLSSCDNLANVLRAAFPDSEIVKNFSLERSKAGYLVSEAIGPYFRQMLLSDIDKNLYYCILYDETTNAAKKKELQVAIRFLSKSHLRVNDHFILQRLFIVLIVRYYIL